MKEVISPVICQDYLSFSVFIIILIPMIQVQSHQIKGNQFPFGLLQVQDAKVNKVLVNKRYKYKNHAEFLKLKEKIENLKTIAHKNTINLRFTQESQEGFIDLYYPYIPISLEDAFSQEPQPSLKDLHKQFISLAIYLAKNYILTSFNPNRCGVVYNQRKYIIKYYLPLNEIIVTQNLSLLERSVQLFNLQSMHYLDTFSNSALNSSRDSSSLSSFIKSKSKSKLNPSSKKRKQSQPVVGLSNARRFSINPNLQQIRKLSNLSKQLSQFSQMRNRRISKESTRNSGGSFSTFKNLISQKSQQNIATKSFISESRITIQRIQAVKQRSVLALKEFHCLKQRIQNHRNLYTLLSKISY